MALKVLMFGWELPPHNSGGLGVACHGLSQALADQNIDITFVLPQQIPVSVDFMRLAFAGIDELNWPNLSAYSILKTGFVSDPLAHDLISAVNKYALAAKQIAQKYNFDLVHAHDWLCYPAGIVASQTKNTPLVSHIHATEFDRTGGTGANPIVYAVEKQGFDQSNGVIAISRFIRSILTKKYSTDPAKINIVHNGVNTDQFSPIPAEQNQFTALKSAGYKIVLFVGRLTLQKGPDYFLLTAQKVLQYAPDTVFIIAGSGDMEQQLVKMCIELGISDKVMFTGFLRGEIWKQLYQAADLLVMPSVSEPFGIVPLESVASGTPVIISKQSGVSEVLNHALKADFWDTEEMADQILSVLKYKSLKNTLTQNGSAEVKKITWANAAAKVVNIYKKILGRS